MATTERACRSRRLNPAGSTTSVPATSPTLAADLPPAAKITPVELCGSCDGQANPATGECRCS